MAGAEVVQGAEGGEVADTARLKRLTYRVANRTLNLFEFRISVSYYNC